MKAERNPHRTYSLLGPCADPPSEYEVTTSRLLYYPGRGFEVDVPLGDWYRAHQVGSPLRCPDWEAFRDPRETTYAVYTRLMQQSEAELERARRTTGARGHGASHAALVELLGPARYLVHGFHMIASYVGHMAPSGRIVLCAAFQAADELRRIEHLARCLAELTQRDAEIAAGRELWEQAPRWQPLRETVERLLVAYDWGESFAGLCLCVKPIVDAALHQALRREAASRADAWLVAAIAAFEEASAWHLAWAEALVAVAVAQDPSNAAVLRRFIDLWQPRAEHAARVLTGEHATALGSQHVRRLAALGLPVVTIEGSR